MLPLPAPAAVPLAYSALGPNCITLWRAPVESFPSFTLKFNIPLLSAPVPEWDPVISARSPNVVPSFWVPLKISFDFLLSSASSPELLIKINALLFVSLFAPGVNFKTDLISLPL